MSDKELSTMKTVPFTQVIEISHAINDINFEIQNLRGLKIEKERELFNVVMSVKELHQYLRVDIGAIRRDANRR